MDNVCVVLFTCLRANGPNYKSPIDFYSREIPSSNQFHIDCINWSTQIRHIEYIQLDVPSFRNHRGTYFSKMEMKQLITVVKNLPEHCEFIYKITGKYEIVDFWKIITRINHRTTQLVVQGARRHSFWGWSSEVFGSSRNLLNAMLMDISLSHNTERFVLKVKKVVSAINASTISFLPTLPLRVPTQRTSDKKWLRYL